ncbi:DMT family transporter [Pseudonocardia kujensis]|uniref:DMT family transporter n=1 Tax=Pseudonocardia kujensis TaxID=1128675 RepID=UPI001E29AA67|nr:DMT family transporter [Pseudonocardia kujensis]MCE0763640.1 DMT family transporter [Pseudonocardia kujensis]
MGAVLAVVAAALNAAASVLQRKAAREEPAEREFSIGLLFDLVRRPSWLGGIACVIVGFLVQAVALTLAGVAVVQPLLVAELPFTVLLAAWAFGARPGRQEWTAIAVLAAGLAMVVVALAPQGGDPVGVPGWMWAVGSAVVALIVGVTVAAGRATTGAARAGWLGVGTGTAFGYVAVLVAAVGAIAQREGVSGVLTAWQTWTVVVVGPLSFFLLQTALQAGSLVASQPGFTLANPLLATAWGVVVYDEHVRGGAWYAMAAAGGAALILGTFVLVRSPLLSDSDDSGDSSESDDSSDDSRAAPR